MLNKQNIQAFERKKSELRGIKGEIAGAAANAAAEAGYGRYNCFYANDEP